MYEILPIFYYLVISHFPFVICCRTQDFLNSVLFPPSGFLLRGYGKEMVAT